MYYHGRSYSVSLAMFDPLNIERYYQALLDKDPQFEGVFYVGVKTTGVFCRPTCSARKPKRENCEFFADAQSALLASYRPCLRCQPLSHPNQVSPLIQALVAAVEAQPEKRWTDADFDALSVDAATARRQFQKRFGMTFVEYARARRLGLAMKHIRDGNSVIDAQLLSGYESGSGFRDAFSRIMGVVPQRAKSPRAQQQLFEMTSVLLAAWLDTPLGPMIAIADESALHLLEFTDRRGLEREIERLRQRRKVAIVPGRSAAIDSIERELQQYFAGQLDRFETPTAWLGSAFQQSVWIALQQIPIGETRTYAQMANHVGRPQAIRAMANANGANQLSIIVPCHRVVETGGGLGGYGGGVQRKQWLLNHERKMARAKHSR